MKKRLSTMLALGVITCGMLLTTGVNVASAEEEKPTADASLSIYSQYIWRGFELSHDSIVLQPSLTVGYKGFAANFWANVDTDTDPAFLDPAEPGGTAFSLTETDITLSYDHSLGPVDLSGGYIYYALDGLTDTQEVYLGGSLDVLLAPTLTVYRDIDSLPGWYVTFGISHSLPIKDYSLDLGAQVGYLSADDASSYAEVNNPTEEFSDLLDGIVSASMSFAVNDYISITPEINYTFALSDEAEDLLEAASVDGDESNFFYGGVSLSFAF